MNVTLILRAVCPICACSIRGLSFRTVRVNKRSVRTTGVGLAFLQPCPECGFHDPTAPAAMHLSAEDAAAITTKQEAA